MIYLYIPGIKLEMCSQNANKINILILRNIKEAKFILH